jgi:hypothetical protein
VCANFVAWLWVSSRESISSISPLSVGEAWFKRVNLPAPRSSSRASKRDEEEDEKDDDGEGTLTVDLGGSLGWALLLGAIGGAGGGAAMMVASGEVARRLHLDVDIVGMVGRGVHLLGDDPFKAGIGVGIALGAVAGIVFGGVLRHSHRLVARMLAAPLLAAVVWTFVHAFVLKTWAPRLGSLPFAPMVIGALAYGLCVAILPPPRRRIVVDLDD